MRDLVLECIHNKLKDMDVDCTSESLNLAILKSNSFVSVCGLLTLVNVFVFYKQTLILRWQAFSRIWSIVDFFIIVANALTFINIIGGKSLIEIENEKKEYEIGEVDAGELLPLKYIRIIECILIVLMWFKSLYYMRLVPDIAPLVESIFVIMNDMLYFLLIFIIGIVAFTEAFWIIGKN